MMGPTPHRTIHRLRASGRTAVAIGAMMLIVAFLLPGLTPAAEAQAEDKCTQYYFLYTDGHTDQGEVCDGPVTELFFPDIHVPNLHISCSDAFNTWVDPDGDEPGGWDSENEQSDLGTHLIADIGGVAQWGVRKSWTGGDDCGLVAPPPPSDPDPANPAASLAFDCTAGLSMLASNDGDEDAELTVLQGTNVIDTITVPKNTTQTEYLVDGENIAEDGSAEFTVMFGTKILVDAQTVEKDCEGPELVTVPDPIPSVDVEKHVSLDGTEYLDADSATGPTFTTILGETQSVWFRVIITNTSGDGTVLTLNSIEDEVTSGDADPIDLRDCTFPEDGLEDGKSVTCDVGPVDAETTQQHTNIVTVSATGAEQTVRDSDPANYLGEIAVGGVVTERPPAPAAPVDPPVGEPEPAPEVEVLGVTEELPRTGPEDLWLAGFALMLLGAGLFTIARGKAMDAMASTAGASWTNHTG